MFARGSCILFLGYGWVWVLDDGRVCVWVYLVEVDPVKLEIKRTRSVISESKSKVLLESRLGIKPECGSTPYINASIYLIRASPFVLVPII